MSDSDITTSNSDISTCDTDNEINENDTTQVINNQHIEEIDFLTSRYTHINGEIKNLWNDICKLDDEIDDLIDEKLPIPSSIMHLSNIVKKYLPHIKNKIQNIENNIYN